MLSSGNLRAQKKLKNIFTFADILPNDTNPGLVIANAIGTPEQRPGNPLTNLKRIIAFGKKSGNPDVLEGIKEVLVDRAYQYSLNKDGIMDFVAFKNYLTKPLAKGQASVLEVLRNTGVLKGDEALRLNTIVNRMIKAQKSIVDDTTAPSEGELVTGMSAFVDLFTRLIGSKIGTSLSQMIPGRSAGLIEASAGVRTVLGFLRVPTSVTQDFILQAARDPKFAKMLLERPTSERQAVVLARRLRTYILNSGLGFLTREIEEEEVKGQPPLPRQFDESFLPIKKQSSVQPNVAGSPTTQITAGPPSGVNNRIAANVGSPPPAAPNVNQRAQLASLFPGDITSGLIKAQQPTQFMQDGGAAYDMGLETDLAAQESIMSALDYNDNNQSDFTPTFPSTFSYTPSNQGAGITSVQTNPLVQNIIDSFKLGNTQIIPEFGKNKVGVTFKRSFADGGIVGLAFGGVSERPGGMDLTPQDYADYMSDAQRTVGRTNYDDAMAEETARQIAAPQVGVSRSNIIGSDTYDPQFAQALNIIGNRLPGNKNLRFGAQRRDDIIRDIGVNEFNRRYGQGVPSLNLPSKLVPQYDGGQYFSFGEKALMEPEGLLSLLMPGGFIRPFLESNFMQGIRKFLPSTKETVTKKTAPIENVFIETLPSSSYSRFTLPEKGVFGGEIVTNPVIALAFGIMQNENINDFSDAYNKAQNEYYRRRGRVKEKIDLTGFNESVQ